jgi:hypothetical protein
LRYAPSGSLLARRRLCSTCYPHGCALVQLGFLRFLDRPALRASDRPSSSVPRALALPIARAAAPSPCADCLSPMARSAEHLPAGPPLPSSKHRARNLLCAAPDPSPLCTPLPVVAAASSPWRVLLLFSVQHVVPARPGVFAMELASSLRLPRPAECPCIAPVPHSPPWCCRRVSSPRPCRGIALLQLAESISSLWRLAPSLVVSVVVKHISCRGLASPGCRL